ncbi:PIG-L family deacetylase [Fibrella aestuarina]|uniref:PIG-L family deacetylase n=1 Tax=Fibrella aestuarina TaxID=651143 RepID=UPI0011D29D2D|nr:PIG-L family deacetylase [Fibrella aestuarina]
MKKRSILTILCLYVALSTAVRAQVPFGKPRPATPGDIQLGIKRLAVLGSVLYIAAHPDDENTLLLTYLHNERNLRTAYLSLTRGDGGQNLIGPEQGENIGVIRTQELLAARRIDGPEQLFSRAYDFGFSKSTDEAVKTWGRDQVLSDIVWLIRKFQPDVIITRFPPDPRAGHGHHSASGFLAEEAFKLSNDPKSYPEQLRYVKPWQAKRLFWNAFTPGRFQSNEKPSESGTLLGLETGLYNPLLGKSYGELAAESRSQHKSQGFGVGANRGARMDYLLLKGGDKPQVDLVEGIDMSWNRVPNSERVQELIYQLNSQFVPAQPTSIVATLVTLHREISQLDTTQLYVRTKRQEVETLLQQCLGLVFEALPLDYVGTPGGTVDIRLTGLGRTNFPVKLTRLRLPQLGRDTAMAMPLKANEQHLFTMSAKLPTNLRLSQPYWLEKPIERGLFNVSDQRLIGLPENPPALTAEFTVEVEGLPFTFTRPWLYKYTDPVEGELYRSFEVRPEVSINLPERVYAFADNQAKTVEVLVKANRANVSGTLSVDVPTGWRVSPNSETFTLGEKYQEQRFTFSLMPMSSSAPEGRLRVSAQTPGGRVTTGLRTISYPHIPPQSLFPPAEAKVERLNIVVKAKNIGYIAGAGDDVPAALRQMGCTVTMLDEAELSKDLSRFDAIVVGVRAYNTEDRLRFNQDKLMSYVQRGGTLVVQYATPGGGGITQSGLKVNQIGPFPFTVGRDRVAEEDATVTMLNPSHMLLNRPNKITDDDFKGWIQERGLYFAQDYDRSYESLFSMNDAGESPKLGSLIYANYGRGHFIYTGLAFFRQLPNGVPGAYRLFANLISAGAKN